MKLGELIAGLDVSLGSGADHDTRICDITEDSRTVVPGSLFVARAGLKADGRKFADDAAHAGAAAILSDDPNLHIHNATMLVSRDVALTAAHIAERFYGNPSSKLDVVAVTGTNGKTTMAWLTWQLLNAAGHRSGLIGTVVIDDGREVAPASMTTPPSIEMSRSLAEMVNAGCKAVALEASSHALDQSRVAALKIDVGVFTNLTRDHLDYHKTMEAYADAKARLFAMLPSDGVAVVNADDAASPRMIRDSKAGVLYCYERGEASSAKGVVARVRTLASDMGGSRLALDGPWGQIEAQVPLIGSYNAMNVLQSVAAAHAVGLSREQLIEGLAAISAPPGRLERVSIPSDPIHVFVDYAHTDDGLKNALMAVRAAMKSEAARLWVVFGCGGDRDAGKRPKMGEIAAQLADQVVITSDNPRTERPGDIVDQILAGITPSRRSITSVQADRARAIEHAIEHATPGDVVVIAGKGHETEQILPDGAGGTIRTHFDDREVARTILAHLHGGRRHAVVAAGAKGRARK